MDVVAQRTSLREASLTLGYSFDGTTPGWPFKAHINITYTLDCPVRLPDSRDLRCPSPLRMTLQIRAVNTHSANGSLLPWTASWHPYFLVPDVSQAALEFDLSKAWHHLICGPGAPRNGNLIPTGMVAPWHIFDGMTPLGGSAA